MNAYMTRETARALLAQSRAYTERKRREREHKLKLAEAFDMFASHQWGHTAAAELAAIYVKSEGK